MLLIGSKALAYNYRCNDSSKAYDVWCTINEFKKFRKISSYSKITKIEKNSYLLIIDNTSLNIKLFHPSSTQAKLIQLRINQKNHITVKNITLYVAALSTLYTISKLCLYNKVNWHKNIVLYHFLKSNINMRSLSKRERFYFKKIHKINLEYELNQHKTMMVKNKEFFSRFKHSFVRIYSHDSLHQSTCYYNKPLYLKLKKDTTMAYVSKKGFDKFSFDDKIKLVKEECYALALERIIIPFGIFNIDICPFSAYKYALRKICTDATKGWFREFALENYYKVIECDTDYVENLNIAKKNNKLLVMHDHNYIDKHKELFQKYIKYVISDSAVSGHNL